MDAPSSPSSAPALLRAYGLRPKKRFGQHFLVDRASARRIADLCVAGNDERIVEIGAGTGELTAELVRSGAHVTALEIDPDLNAILHDRNDLSSATIVEADALTFDFEAAVHNQCWCAAGNLPYNVATPLVARLLELPHPPTRIVAMMQKDVAERLSARPATPAYGSFTLFAAYYTAVHQAFSLKPNAFYPQPKVASTVVVMAAHTVPPIVVRSRTLFLQVVRGAFAYRRKTLANSLSLSLGIERARTQEALASLGIDTEIRAEHLDLDSFGALADSLAE